MITFQQARKIALGKIGPNCALIEDRIIEKANGWYFAFQSKQYLASRDASHALVGSGGFIVEREDGRIFEFGSVFPLERNLRDYDEGFRYRSYDLTILGVSDTERTVGLLRKLSMKYVIPETEHGVEWRIPRQYTEAQIKGVLRELPCTFANQDFNIRVEVFDEMDAARCCEYALRGHRAEDGGNT